MLSASLRANRHAPGDLDMRLQSQLGVWLASIGIEMSAALPSSENAGSPIALAPSGSFALSWAQNIWNDAFA